MPITKFPNPREAPPDGLLAIGGDLHPASLILAYSKGIFPWPVPDPDSAPGSEESEMILAWFSPDPRAILDFSVLHLPRSLAKAGRNAGFHFTLDQAFDQVIEACAQVPRPGQPGTWITPSMLEAYRDLHRLGIAHSAETWRENQLVGGIYGVEVQGCFAGESMFHRETNASKLALLHLVAELRTRGIEWMDIQMMTPHLEALGAREISRDEYLTKLSRTQALGRRPFGDSP